MSTVLSTLRAKEQVKAIPVWLPASVASLGGLRFAFDTAVINSALVFLKRYFVPIYARMCAITFFVVLKAVPETKWRTLED